MRSGVHIKTMNFLKAQPQIRPARQWCVLLAAILLVAAITAGAAEPNRFLLAFETSSALKKNLPAVKQTLDALLASNLQGEIQENDDLAVWTVDQSLHTGTYPLESWSRDDAQDYGTQLKDFLGRQKFTRHASLAALQPLLNRVAKNSAQLTVLIFCDGQSNLIGTPYDSGVNAILKKTTVQSKVAPGLFVLVLRSYQGEYLGCSVNRMAGLLNFPKFPPPPPKPEPPLAKPEPVMAPVVAPIAPLIIVGTNVGTNISALTKPAPQPAPPIVTNPPANITPAAPPAVAVVVAPVIANKIVTAPAANPAPASNPPPSPPSAPAPAPVVQKISVPEPVAVVPAVVIPAKPAAATNSTAVASAGPDTSNDAGFQKLIFIAGGLLVAAVALVIWLVTRSRQPRGSLITSSMQDDPRLPPRK
jgi:hypothetical protein